VLDACPDRSVEARMIKCDFDSSKHANRVRTCKDLLRNRIFTSDVAGLNSRFKSVSMPDLSDVCVSSAWSFRIFWPLMCPSYFNMQTYHL
jgi:hypothetical protein